MMESIIITTMSSVRENPFFSENLIFFIINASGGFFFMLCLYIFYHKFRNNYNFYSGTGFI